MHRLLKAPFLFSFAMWREEKNLEMCHLFILSGCFSPLLLSGRRNNSAAFVFFRVPPAPNSLVTQHMIQSAPQFHTYSPLSPYPQVCYSRK